MRLRPVLGLVVLIGVLAGLGGCTLFRGGYHLGWYRVGGVRYRVGPLPEPWAIDYVDSVDLLFRHPDGSRIYSDNSCARNREAPLTALANHLMSGFTEVNRQDDRFFALDGREALTREFEGRLDGVPVRVMATVVKKDGCIFDMSMVSFPERFEAHRGSYQSLVEGFSARVRE